MILTPRLREAEALLNRMETWTQAQKPEDLSPILNPMLSNIVWLDALLKKMPWVIRLDHLRSQAGSPTPVGNWLTGALTLGCTIGVVGLVLLQFPFFLAVVLSALGTCSPFLYLLFMRRQRAQLFQEQLPDALDMLIRTIQAGHALIMGMKLVGEEFKEPSRARIQTSCGASKSLGDSFPRSHEIHDDPCRQLGPQIFCDCNNHSTRSRGEH